MKKVLLLIFAGVISLFSIENSSAGDTLICKGSGEHCMEVDMGNGTSAKFVKTKGSPAVIIKE